ncbi:MAG: hypothetical protein ACYC2R_08395 [Burkholderiales bacterium]
MQLQPDSCRDMAMNEMQPMDQMQHADARQYRLSGSSGQNQAKSTHRHASSCNGCSVCHFACSNYLTAPSATSFGARHPGALATPYLLSFRSITSTPLVPPPLARS